MDQYFKKFPKIYYSNTLCVDIARRVKINDNEDVQGNLNKYYPYELIHHLRPDHIAEYYYKDPEQDWLIYLTNQTIDPYYGWYLTDAQFATLIINKYESIPVAQRSIAYYVNNWYDDSNQLSVAIYDNTIDMKLKKFYEPVWGQNQTILAYKRKQLLTCIKTNRILNYTIDTISGTFSNNEPVDFTNGGGAVGQGMIVCSNSTVLTIQSVSNDWIANSSVTKTINGLSSGASATSNAYSNVIINILDDEQVFYSPITFYDLEVETNEQKKNINLIGAGYQTLVSQKIKATLQINTDPTTGMTTE